jgi:hypothetical protein
MHRHSEVLACIGQSSILPATVQRPPARDAARGPLTVLNPRPMSIGKRYRALAALAIRGRLSSPSRVHTIPRGDPVGQGWPLGRLPVHAGIGADRNRNALGKARGDLEARPRRRDLAPVARQSVGPDRDESSRHDPGPTSPAGRVVRVGRPLSSRPIRRPPAGRFRSCAGTAGFRRPGRPGWRRPPLVVTVGCRRRSTAGETTSRKETR